MSVNLYIGLSKKQIEKLLAGEQVGKRPYFGVGYNDTIRVFVKMLSDKEEQKEPTTAFDW